MSASSSPKVAQALSERFEVLSILGEGGYGVVHEALDRERDLRVALKSLQKLTPDAVFRFKREFRALRDMSHKNLVELFELFEHEGQWFFSMELVEGVDLLSYVWIERPVLRTPLKPPAVDVARLRSSVSQLLEGLAVLHEQGKVHRDIKPSNVRITAEGRAVLLDFGLVTDASEIRDTTDAQITGTVGYMAPEQATSATVGPAADMYSVGSMLYEALTGTVPFVGAPLQVLVLKQRGHPPPPRELNPDAPRDLEALCLALLSPDPDARPTLRQAQHALGNEGVEPRALNRTREMVFVGRELELSKLRTAYERIKRRMPAAVYVSGESGVGKSALVRELTERLVIEDEDALVLVGRCFESESVPYKAFDGVIDALSRTLRKLNDDACRALLPRRAMLLSQAFPVLGRVRAIRMARGVSDAATDQLTLRQRVFEALRELFARLSDRRRLVIVLEDLQWADAESLALLEDLCRPPDAPVMLVLCTGRPIEDCPKPVSECLERLGTSSDGLATLTLGALSAAEAESLTQRLLDDAAFAVPHYVRQIARESAGHPLFINELVRFVSEAHDTTATERLQLERALGHRIDKLDPEARVVIELLAVGVAPLPADVVAEAAALETPELATKLGALRTMRLVRTSRARGAQLLEIFHDRLRQAVVARLSAETRRERHEQLALALEVVAQAEPEALTVHWVESGHPERAVSYAVKAADRAREALAFNRAARLYREALDLSVRTDTPVPRELWVAMADALVNAGRGSEAADAYLRAAKGAEPAEALEMRRRAAQHLLRSGDVTRGLDTTREVLASIGIELPERIEDGTWARTRTFLLNVFGSGPKPSTANGSATPDLGVTADLLWSVTSSLSMVDRRRAQHFQELHLQAAKRSGDPYREARALALDIWLSNATGRKAEREAASTLVRARMLADTCKNPHAQALVALASGIAAHRNGDSHLSRKLYEEAVTIFRERCTGVAWELDNAQYFLVTALHGMGEYGELARQLPSMLRDAEDRGNLYALTNMRLMSFVYHLVHDDVQGARRTVELAGRGWAQRGFEVQHAYHLYVETLVELYAGAPDVYERFAARWPEVEASGLLKVEVLGIYLYSVRARTALVALLEGHQESRELLRIVDAAASWLESRKAPYSPPHGHLLRAAALDFTGKREQALTVLERGASVFETQGMAMYAASARYRQGQLEGTERGRARREKVERWMREQGVKSPRSMINMYATGFPE